MDVVVREGAHLSLLFQSRGVANSKLGSDHAPRIYGRRRVPQAWWLSWRPVEVPKSPPHLAVGGNNASPWTKRTAKFRQSILPYEGEQLFPGDRTAPREAAALVLIGMNVAPEHEREFNEWYNTQHIAALSAVPGGPVRPPQSPRRRYAALCRARALPPNCARGGALSRMVQSGEHPIDPAHAAAFRDICVSSAAAILAPRSKTRPCRWSGYRTGGRPLPPDRFSTGG